MKATAGQIALTALNVLLTLGLALALFSVLRGADRAATAAPDAVVEQPPPSAERDPDVEPRLPPQEQSQRLVMDLLDRSDLIPFDGILGGTMGFYTPDNVFVLSNRWVYARFEDGHIGGEMLLEYRIDGVGGIDWTVLYAELH
ncbi:MAG: hypothetical protein EA384_04210 [Spirochaetaceae bacterium]|nr:MAG: hypothetical protein EA384_04210 [Spirochaetaceae bacterium]